SQRKPALGFVQQPHVDGQDSQRFRHHSADSRAEFMDVQKRSCPLGQLHPDAAIIVDRSTEMLSHETSKFFAEPVRENQDRKDRQGKKNNEFIERYGLPWQK